MNSQISTEDVQKKTSFYDLKTKDYKGTEFPFEDLKGKVVLIVNTASKCKLTPQYKELEELNKKYAGKDVQILGFPCNQFANQEPAGNVEIITFCSRNYGVTFPVLGKVKVNGVKADPVYKYLKNQKPGIFGLKAVKWNFEKFLINKQGEVVERYSCLTKPSKLGPKIDALLNEAPTPCETATLHATATI
ncbi:hypothetical protein JCM33374_g1314 [Metschnikowia sp. JCM 33374]|nr:hypothetical protein JCM33374_g1314 [Metschnikowia sp. JCM 33374]